MATNIKFSKDPKIQLISLENFLEDNDYLIGITKEDLWNDSTIPSINHSYFKITSLYFIFIQYGESLVNFGMDMKEKLELIQVAYRDGKTEYELLDKKLKKLKEERAKHRKSKKIDTEIEKLQEIEKIIPKYKEHVLPIKKPFESYLIECDYKTSKKELMGKYLVFDVETNGIRKSNDDLLSLSIYDPTTGICYNRFFPLDLQPLVLTTFIHGITDETLENATHITQEEMNWLIEYFHMKDRILLSYSGGQGTFDSSFVINYCKRHHVIGFENLKFENIKRSIPQVPFGMEGQLTKDNLCRIFKIEGVNKVHSSFNDCILQWKLFEKLEGECVFFIGEHLYKYNSKYIIPYTYFFRHNELIKYANIKIPYIRGEVKEIFKLGFPKSLLKRIKKFPTNITGITIENGINALLGAVEQNNIRFLMENKSHLEYVGSLDSRIEKIPVITEEDGTIRAIREEDKEYIGTINATTKLIVEQLHPVVKFLKNKIFVGNTIMSQELSISSDRKVLALCDLSDGKNVVEIKTCNVLENETSLKEGIARQLYYQSNGRNTYLLSIKFDTHYTDSYEEVVDDLNLFLYSIKLSVCDSSKIVRTRVLIDIEVRVLTILKNNPNISKTKIANKIGCSLKTIASILDDLEMFGYVKKDNLLRKNCSYILLRETTDITTKYVIDEEGVIHIIKNLVHL